MLTQAPLWPEPQPARRPSPRLRLGRRASERRRKRWTIGIVAAVASMVVAAGSAYAFGLFEPEATDSPSAMAGAQVAIAESASLQADLTTELSDARAVLKSPDGKAADKSVRRVLTTAITDAERVVTSLESVTTSPSGTVAEATAVLEASSALDDDVPAVTAALREASGAVIASGRQARMDRAVSGLEEARDALKTAMVGGEQVHAESAADAAGQDVLRAALDDAGDLTAQADALLERAADAQTTADAQAHASRAETARADTAQASAASEASTDLLDDAGRLTKALAEATAVIQEAAAAVSAEAADDAAEAEAEDDTTDPAAEDTGTDLGDDTATTGDTDTAPAGTCPEPDQVWSAGNGHLSSSELAQIPFASGHYVRSDVVGGLAELNAAYAAEFGVNITINSSYRTYAQQEALYDPSSDTAAPPGCSNHGTGLAIDIGGGVQTFGSAQYDWLKANAEDYGWVHPPFAEPSGRNHEPWHWQSVKAPNSY